jgi:hypothetical protein
MYFPGAKMSMHFQVGFFRRKRNALFVIWHQLPLSPLVAEAGVEGKHLNSISTRDDHGPG